MQELTIHNLKQIDQYRRELGMKESVNESVYKFLVVNTKTGEIESAGSTLDGRNGAKETKKEIERKGKKMQILQLKKKVSDRQMERMLGYTLKQSGIDKHDFYCNISDILIL